MFFISFRKSEGRRSEKDRRKADAATDDRSERRTRKERRVVADRREVVDRRAFKHCTLSEDKQEVVDRLTEILEEAMWE